MLIDGNANIGHWPFRHRTYNTCEALLQRMDQFGVDISVIGNLSAVFYKNTQTANRELHEMIRSKRKYRGRFVPFSVINPIYGGWKDDFDRCTGEFGMKGVRLYPKYHGYELNDPRCIELVQMARDKGITVALTLRVVDRRPSSWLDIREEWALKDVIPLIKSVPDAKYMILNVANSTGLDKEETALMRNTRVVMDTSGRAILNLGELLKIFGPDKFAFGTHSPVLDYCTGLLRIESLRPGEADEKTREQLRSGNIKNILEL